MVCIALHINGLCDIMRPAVTLCKPSNLDSKSAEGNLVEVRPSRHKPLGVVVSAVIAAEVGFAEVVSVGLIWAQLRIVAGSFLELAVALGVIAAAVVSVACTVAGAHLESLVVGLLD